MHRKDSLKKYAILASVHFQNPNLIFQKHAKCIVIEQITKKCNTTEEHNLILKKEDNFGILNLHTLSPYV